MIDWDALARPALRGLVRYDPGPSRDELKRRHDLDELVPLNWNEDRFEPPRAVLDAAAAEVYNAALYPERLFADFRAGVASWLTVPAECVTPAHGAQALISVIAQVFVGEGTPVIVPNLTYGLYASVCTAAGGVVTRVPPAGLALDLDGIAGAASTANARLVWICDPNNPTGTLIERSEWSAFLERLPSDCIVVADEAYIDFADPGVRVQRERDVLAGRPVIVIRSCSKIFGLAGLRLGYAVSDPSVARLLDLVQEPFNVNRAALAAGLAAVSQPSLVAERRALVVAARALLSAELEEAGFTVHPSQANFVLVELGVDDVAVCDELMRRGILIRGGTEFGLPGLARVTVAPEPVMLRTAAAIADTVGALR
ncbi:MAG: histidinol-phosphate aminotransferase [Solirubrobacteraceae bacterium]|jgi:histidinol-phosphate aminotransferase|nr:histidinol-phosphate aminotransferase [Solirubrobacteraceae bacterium]